MERNKQIIVLVVCISCFSGLAWYIYVSFFPKKEKEKEIGIQFEVPEVSNIYPNTSKIEYYNANNSKDISDGFLLEKVDTLSVENNESNNENNPFENILYKREDLSNRTTNPYVSNSEKTSTKKAKNIPTSQHLESIQQDGDITKLLKIMESNAQQMDNIGKEVTTSESSSSFQSNFSNRGIKEIIEKSHNTQKDIPEPIYKKLPVTEISPKPTFFGASKDKKAFKGAVSDLKKSKKKELYKAEFYNTQLVENGGLVTIHLLEDVFFEEDFFIPKYTILYGIAQFSPRRLFLRISPNIIKNEKRLPEEVLIYDFDGLEGIYMKVNSVGSIPVETARELTELVKESYKNSNIITGSASVPLKEASIILGSDKILKYLNRLKVKISGGYKIWLSVKENN